MASFIDANFDSPLDLLKPWRAGLELVKLGGFGNLGKKVASFFDDERLQRIFSFQSMYAGLAPYEALALYAVITYMDSVEGVFVPEGGMHMMAHGPRRRGRAGRRRHPVLVARSPSITRAVRRPGHRRRDSDGDEHVAADAVVCNADLPVAYRELLPASTAPAGRPQRASTRRRVVLWVAGVRGLPPPDATHHNIHFGARLGRLVQGADRRRRADARPVDPRDAAQPRRPVARPRRVVRASTCSNRHRT